VGATSTAAATAVNRNNHVALPAAETLAALASVMSDYVYQSGPLAEAYEETLTHDEHTWGHHFPAGPAAHTAQLEKAVHAYRGGALSHDVLNKAMARIADHVRVEGTGFPLVVFNLTRTPRTDIVRTPLRELDNCGSTIVTVPPEKDAQGTGYLRGVLLHDRWHFNLPSDVIRGGFDVVDAVTGASVPYQLISIEADAPVPYAAERAGLGAGTRRYGLFELPVGVKQDLCFVAADVPAYGYRTYKLVPHANPSQPKRGVKGLATTLENAFYRIVVSRRSGAIVSILDKELGRELVDDRCQHPFNTLVVRDPFGAEWEMMRARVRKGVSGPICSSIEVTAAVHGHPVVQQSITLYAGVKRIELATRILKDATPLLDVHLAFPFNVVHPGFRYESVLAAVEPVKDYLPGSQWDRVAVQNWVKVGADDFTILWSSLDAPVVSLGRLWPGYVSPAHRCVVTEDVKQHRRLTSADLQRGWIYSDICYNNLGTNFSVSQSGDMLFRYAVTSRSGAASDGAAADFGWQAVTPLSTILARPLPQAHLPVSDRLLRVQGEHVVLLALKQAEDGRGYIARLWNMGDCATTAQIQLCGMHVRKALRTNAVEEDLEVLVLNAEHEVQVPIGARALSSVRLLLNQSH
ncbi:MAG: glycosyl hydrolase-related protein, partial [Chloroflexi bacterium]|nr:glycosyl hydrolase-related protein [Chloroflexota bacterium]